MPDIPISHSEENIAKHQQEKKVARKVDDKDLHNVYAAVRKLFSCNLIPYYLYTLELIEDMKNELIL